ncbi:hypothetical protein ACFC18_10445 [Streptomyces sp. NPDC056121]|uniref:hypothetical protein n=1 Tax=Streptomyces sp. NPDC056121 TaxID=3345718 RepID=UPI0035E3B2A3
MAATNRIRGASRFARLRRWYQRFDWARHTAVLAAVVAAASLAITAWGTYKSAQVADDQLAQSKADNEKDERSQSARIAMWGDTKVSVVANRSLDPAWAAFFLNDKQRRENHDNTVTYVYVGVVPPCSAVSIPKAVIFAKATRFAQPHEPRTGWLFQGLHFMVNDGQGWVRWNNGALTKSELPHPSKALQQQKEDGGLMADDRAKLKPLSECGKAD